MVLFPCTVFGGFSQAFCCSSLAWGVGVSSCRWVLWFLFSCLGSSSLGVLFFRARLCILAQAYMCQGHHFLIGVCFKDVNFSSYPTWLARPHSASFEGSLRIVFSFPTQSHPSTPSSSFSSWMWTLETHKKREAEVLRGLHKHPKFQFFL